MKKETIDKLKQFNIKHMSTTQVSWVIEQLPDLLVHIDNLAKQVTDLQEDLNIAHENRINATNSWTKIHKDQATQIVTLKKIAIRERDRYLVDFLHEYDDVRDCKSEARQQLEAEYEVMRK